MMPAEVHLVPDDSAPGAGRPRTWCRTTPHLATGDPAPGAGRPRTWCRTTPHLVPDDTTRGVTRPADGSGFPYTRCRMARTGGRPAPTRGRIARTCSADPSHVDPARSHPGARHSHVGPPRSHSPSADVHACAGHPAHATARPDHCCRAARTLLQPARQQVPTPAAATANWLATTRGRSRISCRVGRTAFPVVRTRSQDARTSRRLARTGTRIGRTDRRRIRTNSGRHCIHFHSRSHGPAGRRAGWAS
jgi:hypothetical protein